MTSISYHWPVVPETATVPHVPAPAAGRLFQVTVVSVHALVESGTMAVATLAARVSDSFPKRRRLGGLSGLDAADVEQHERFAQVCRIGGELDDELSGGAVVGARVLPASDVGVGQDAARFGRW